MNCSNVLELLSAYYDAELPDGARLKMDGHFKRCPGCARDLAGFEKLSVMASVHNTPPPADYWSRLERQLDGQPCDIQSAAESVEQTRNSSFTAPSLFALAATVLVAVGIGWFSYSSWSGHGQRDQFAVEFGQYLDAFRSDPNAAQQILLAKYTNQLVRPDQAIERIGYRPAVADDPPEGYTLVSTHVMKMPCCTCVQSICKRNDGSMLAIFEHDDENTTEWFGGRPEITASCNDKRCCLIELDDQIAASWKRGTRYITLIGVRDIAEVGEMVAWLDEKKRLVPN